MLAMVTGLTAVLGAPLKAQTVPKPGTGYQDLLPPPDLPAPEKPPEPKPVRPEPQPVATDDCLAGLEERNGVVTLSVRDPARVNRTFSVTADGYTYESHFDMTGGVRFRAPLFQDPAAIEWTGANGRACQRPVPFPERRDILGTALIWSGPYDLGLQVTEPSGQKYSMLSSSATGGVSALAGINNFEAFGEPGGKGMRAILYTMPAERKPVSGTLYFKVEFTSRGNPARPPFCGATQTAQVSYTIIQLSGGLSTRRNGEFRSVPCGTAWASDEDGFSPVWQLKF